eukprot:43084_1
MPKQYRDYHLTPKNTTKSALRKRHNKRYSMNESAFDRICRDDKKEQSEEPRNKRSTDVLQLENRIADLQNDLHRETSKNKEFQKEIETLQRNITVLKRNDTLNGDKG